MAYSDNDILLNLFMILILIVISHVLIAFQKAFAAGKLSLLKIITAIKSEFDLVNIKRACLGALGVVVISSFASKITEGDSTTISHLFSHFLWLFRKKDNDPAIGLAWSYYFGYCKKVLPTLKGNLWQSKHRDNTFEKLFILVPSDCKVYDDKLNEDDSKIEFIENLISTKDNVAGIRMRKYVNTLYRVNVNNEMFYAAIEYATPLKTLLSMSHHKEAGLSRAERDHQVIVFYETIKDIIMNHADPPEIKDSVEFIFLEEGMSIADEICKVVVSSRTEQQKGSQ